MKASRLQCPAVTVTTLKQQGLIVRCGCWTAPHKGLCHQHLARQRRGREVLVLDWSDEVKLTLLSAQAARAHRLRLAEIKAQADARAREALEAWVGRHP